MAEGGPLDPYPILAALERRLVSYIVIGSFARVVRGAEEIPDGLDFVPSDRGGNLGRVQEALEDLEAVRTDGQTINLEEHAPRKDEIVELSSPHGALKVVTEPPGTRGYDDLRRAASREYLGRGLRPRIASIGDLARMLGALGREQDAPKLHALRRIGELERSLGHELAL